MLNLLHHKGDNSLAYTLSPLRGTDRCHSSCSQGSDRAEKKNKFHKILISLTHGLFVYIVALSIKTIREGS